MDPFSKSNYLPTATPQPTTKRLVDSSGGDFYPTPDWATHALLEYEDFVGSITEPACGDGAMARVLIQRGYPVITSDLYDRGYGQTGVDFLTLAGPFDNVVTNPPYHLAAEFALHAIERTRGKVALFLRLAFLEGVERYERLYSCCRPDKILVFTNRVTLYPAGAEKKGSSTTAYAWFIWDMRSVDEGTTVEWIDPELKKRYGG